MKFKIIEQDTSRKVTGEPKLRFTHQGSVSVNGAGVEKLALPDNPYVIIVQDEEKQNDFYLIITKEKKYPALRKASGKSMVFNYASAYQVIASHFNLPKGINFDLYIGGQIKTELGTAFYLKTEKLCELVGKEGIHG